MDAVLDPGYPVGQLFELLFFALPWMSDRRPRPLDHPGPVRVVPPAEGGPKANVEDHQEEAPAGRWQSAV